jgi:hypothetical protein
MKLEQMNQIAQSGLIAAVSDGAFERGIDALAKQAARIYVLAFSARVGNGRGRGLPAYGAI